MVKKNSNGATAALCSLNRQPMLLPSLVSNDSFLKLLMHFKVTTPVKTHYVIHFSKRTLLSV